MSTVLRSFYNNLKEPVIICDFKNDTFYTNKAFKNTFGSISPSKGIDTLKKIDYKFHFEFCTLDNEKLKTYSPFIEALTRKNDFTIYGMYQKNERSYLYFIINAFNFKKYRVIYFYDLTQELQCSKALIENEKLKIQNQEFINTKSKAQNQAVKMALLNRISNSISRTIDVNNLINTALKELSIIFGANKVYFASRKDEEFEIEYAYPENSYNKKNKIIKYEDNINKVLLEHKSSIQVCLKEHENAKEALKVPVTRIIMPVIRQDNLIAVVIIFTPKKNITDTEKELLKGISITISNAIFQAMLFKEVSKKKEELESAIKELKETQLQLINSEKMASLGQLIASVAHEINTPLASISANNEIAKKLYKNIDAIAQPDIAEILSETNSIDADAIKRITNLVQSLKRFVRLDETVSQNADINQELDLTLNLLKHKTKKGIKIVKNYSDIPSVECYPNMLNQVFLNILMNAIQSIEKQANIIKESTMQNSASYQGEIKITTDVKDKVLTIAVEDNGAGIKEHDKKKIFQAGFTTKKVGEGTGLGLAICKKIIEKHNGNIYFYTESRKGNNDFAAFSTVFKIEIPV